MQRTQLPVGYSRSSLFKVSSLMSVKEIFGLKIILCIVEKSPDLESEHLALRAWFLGRTMVPRDIHGCDHAGSGCPQYRNIVGEALPSGTLGASAPSLRRPCSRQRDGQPRLSAFNNSYSRNFSKNFCVPFLAIKRNKNKE